MSVASQNNLNSTLFYVTLCLMISPSLAFKKPVFLIFPVDLFSNLSILLIPLRTMLTGVMSPMIVVEGLAFFFRNSLENIYKRFIVVVIVMILMAVVLLLLI